jgi:hypothetical protein
MSYGYGDGIALVTDGIWACPATFCNANYEGVLLSGITGN